jgi:hypothetical protein
VQSFRRRAQAAANLKSDDKQVVKTDKEIIIFQPAGMAGGDADSRPATAARQVACRDLTGHRQEDHHERSQAH